MNIWLNTSSIFEPYLYEENQVSYVASVCWLSGFDPAPLRRVYSGKWPERALDNYESSKSLERQLSLLALDSFHQVEPRPKGVIFYFTPRTESREAK